MKGHIFNLLETFVVEATDVATYEEIHASCTFQGDGVFLRPGKYPDADLLELVDKTVAKLGMTTSEAYRAFGRWIFPHLAELVPKEMVAKPHPKDFLMTLDAIHRVELKKLWPDAEPPGFRCLDIDPERMLITYNSPREMFALVEGVLESVADYYGVPIEFSVNYRTASAGHRIADYQLRFGTPADAVAG
jgi:hypothetical protein